MPITSRGKGYPIPDNPEPEGYHCVKVYVPDDSLYIGIFWQSLHFLASPRAWANDADHTAVAAAEVWRAAIQKSQEIDSCGSGECGIMDVRQNESVPCKLEKQEDCSEEWEQFADMRLCVPKMRFVGGVLQQDTTGEGDWQDAGDPEEPYDPRKDAPYTPPWVEPPVGQDGKCLSAANVATYIDFCCYHFAGSMVDLLTFFETLSGAVTILTALMDLIPLTLLTAVITELYVQVVDDWADVRDFVIIPKLTELLVCRYEADGSMTESNWTQVMADCNAWRDTLTDNDARAKWWIAIQLINLWGPVGMSIVGAIWGIVEYDCEYNECAWSHTFDFTDGEQGWALDDLIQISGGGTSGQHVAGGWQHTDVTEVGSYHARDCSIDINFAETTLTRIQCTIEWHTGYWGANAYAFYAATDETNYQKLVFHGDMPEGVSVQDVTFNDATTRVRIASRASYEDWGGSILITSVTLHGTGVDPWA